MNIIQTEAFDRWSSPSSREKLGKLSPLQLPGSRGRKCGHRDFTLCVCALKDEEDARVCACPIRKRTIFKKWV